MNKYSCDFRLLLSRTVYTLVMRGTSFYVPPYAVYVASVSAVVHDEYLRESEHH